MILSRFNRTINPSWLPVLSAYLVTEATEAGDDGDGGAGAGRDDGDGDPFDSHRFAVLVRCLRFP